MVGGDCGCWWWVVMVMRVGVLLGGEGGEGEVREGMEGWMVDPSSKCTGKNCFLHHTQTSSLDLFSSDIIYKLSTSPVSIHR